MLTIYILLDQRWSLSCNLSPACSLLHKELLEAKDWLTDMLQHCNDQLPILVKIIAFGFCIRTIPSVGSAVSFIQSYLLQWLIVSVISCNLRVGFEWKMGSDSDCEAPKEETESEVSNYFPLVCFNFVCFGYVFLSFVSNLYVRATFFYDFFLWFICQTEVFL